MSSQPLRFNSDDSDDEIVWNVSGDSTSSAGSSVSGGDFVLLSYPASAARSVTGRSTPGEGASELIAPIASQSLEARMSALSIATRPPNSKCAVKKGKKAAAKPTASTTMLKKKAKKNTITTPVPGVVPSTTKTKGDQGNELVKFTGLGARPIVDDFSDRQSIVSYDNESVLSLDSPSLYEEASNFISS